VKKTENSKKIKHGKTLSSWTQKGFSALGNLHLKKILYFLEKLAPNFQPENIPQNRTLRDSR